MLVGVIGAGAWGTALGQVAADAGHKVLLWAREPEVVQAINTTHVNAPYLPGVELHKNISATEDLADLRQSNVIVHATPTQHTRSVLQIANNLGVLHGATLVSVAKGIEIGTHKLVRDIVADVAPTIAHFAVLSGPSHAEEVSRRMPTSVVCACDTIEQAQHIQHMLRTDDFRVYTSSDVIGVEICGALKNVIAIAAGIVDGVGMGDNTKAALITRGLAEMARLGTALGADVQTFYGLAGLGDLIVTTGSRHSRNRFVGEQVGKGRNVEDVLGSMTAVAEGVPTTRAALELAHDMNIELPITQKVAEVLWEGADPRTAIRALMQRPLGPETQH